MYDGRGEEGRRGPERRGGTGRRARSACATGSPDASPAPARVPRTVRPRSVNTDAPGYLADCESDPERVSDHDPLVVALLFRPGDPTGTRG